jgi:hypothetical protein
VFKILSTYTLLKKIYKMQYLEGSGTPVLYIGRKVSKGLKQVTETQSLLFVRRFE